MATNSNDTDGVRAHDNKFYVGNEDLLEIGEGTVSEHPIVDAKKLADIQIRIGTLLKTDNVSFLLGAGASCECGGPLLGSIPFEIEEQLIEDGTRGNRVSNWLKVFYIAAKEVANRSDIKIAPGQILRRKQDLETVNREPIHVNFEELLSVLYRWRMALPKNSGRMRLYELPTRDLNSDLLDKCINYAKRALIKECQLPKNGKESSLLTFTIMLRKLLTRPLNLKRVNLFSLNYDTLVEQAADTEGIVLLDGFVGTHTRIFRPESYEQDLYFPAETTEGHVHRFDRVMHLYKLHGSISWSICQPTIENPYGIQANNILNENRAPVLIYPTPSKYGETLGLPYSELFRRFANVVVRPQSALFVIGYGFGDEHVNAIIRQALAIPSFTMVIVDPSPLGEFVSILKNQKDKRVWIAEGKTIGTFSGFVNQVLPDLRDEDIRVKVLSTYRALDPNISQSE